MRSQWDCLLQNLGEWQGSFTNFSPQGEPLTDTPTVVSLEGLNQNKTVRQVIRRYPPDRDVEETVLEYSTLARSVLVFETGAFSQGSMQWGPFSEFGAELGLIAGNRRLRLVQLYNKEAQLSQLTLIREKRAGTDTPERPPLTVDQLLGEWQGEAITLYPDLRSPDTYSTKLTIERPDSNRLVQQLTFGVGESVRTLTSSARIDGSILHFQDSALPVQVVLLPDGASSNCPLTIQSGHSFVLEVGWLIEPNLRQRLIRRYSDRASWVSLTLVQEKRINN
ncbi:MAG: DUF3598 family protein [Coleofasciculus sp. C1-SOL-03]|jgi:hypothetical protein|uniref:DUF3598 family protein n=1 Tax=Coleofasciculus sp. C1-SOL-03 TaxID=3069522 RepID=UPI0033022D87